MSKPIPNQTHHSPAPGHAHEEGEMILDLRMLIGMVAANRVFILIAVLIFLIFGSIYAVTRTPIFQSTALIEVEGSSSNASNLLALMNVAGASSSGFGSTATPAEIETSLIQSEYIMGDVIRELKLSTSVQPHYFPLIGKLIVKFNQSTKNDFIPKLFPSFTWSNQEAVKVENFSVPNYLGGAHFQLIAGEQPNHFSLYNESGEKVLDGVVGQPAVSNNTISLTVSKLIARPGQKFTVTQKAMKAAVSGVLGGLSIEEKGDSTGILELSYHSSNAAFAQKFLNKLLEVSVAKNIATKAEEAGKTLDFLKNQLPAVTEELNAAESTLNNYRSETGNIDSAAEAQILLQQMIALQKEIEDFKLKRLELLQSFTEEHPYVIAMDQQREVIEDKLKQVEERLRGIPQAAQQAMNFKRDISVQGGIYTNVIQNMQQLEMLKASTVSTVRILTYASYAVLPLPGKTGLIVLVSMLLGTFASLGVLLIRQALRKGIEDPMAVERALGVHTLAVVPFSRAQVELMQEMNKEKKQQTYLLSKEKSKDVSVEALRALRTSLKLSLIGADRAIISVTGSSPGVGKSFVSSNLTSLFADLDQKVLLIDADMRKGHTYRMLGGRRSPGLSEYLQTDRSFSDAVQSVTKNIDLLSTGHYPANPVELLMTAKFQRLMDEVLEKYDVVIIDTPPVLAVTDAAVILKHSLINLLVVGSGKDQLKELQHVKSMLEKSGVELHGTVFNNLNAHSQKYGYGGYYNYYYSYE